MRLWGAILAVMLTAAPALAQDTAKPAEPVAEPEDAFILQIDVGRHNVFIDKAFEGIGVKIPYVFRENGGIGADEPDIWLGLREIGRDGVVLKEIMCAKGHVGPKRCARAKPPTWIDAQPTPVPHLATLRTYEEELAAFLDPFVEVGCRLGRARTKDDMFCSVE